MMKINRQATQPIWKQLLDQAVHNITSGKWKAGYQLPPTRELAQHLEVSRSTVQTVYEELYSRGYTVTSRRGGTRVSDWNEAFTMRETSVAQQHLLPPDLPVLKNAVNQFHDWSRGKGKQAINIDFSPHEPYLDTIFLKKWRQSFLHATNKEDIACWLYGDPYGYEPLRYEIQNYLSVVRGIHVELDQILLTSGAQQSIDLISQALLIEGDTVAVEDPGFPPAGLTMMYRKMNIVPVPVDEQGIIVDHIPNQSKLIFVTPAHQSATGVIMSAKRRRQIIKTAIQNQAWIIEDDYDGEFRHKGDPLPPLFSQEQNHTLYLMSFSKMIAPGIRLSAIIGPVAAIAQIARVRELTVRHLPIMEQLTLTHFMQHGHFLRHMRRVKNIYRRRREAMIEALAATKLDTFFSVKGVDTGLHLLLEADGEFNEEEWTKKVLAHGVRVYPLGPYCIHSTRKGWVLGYSKVDEDTIVDGIYKIARVLEKHS